MCRSSKIFGNKQLVTWGQNWVKLGFRLLHSFAFIFRWHSCIASVGASGWKKSKTRISSFWNKSHWCWLLFCACTWIFHHCFEARIYWQLGFFWPRFGKFRKRVQFSFVTRETLKTFFGSTKSSFERQQRREKVTSRTKKSIESLSFHISNFNP